MGTGGELSLSNTADIAFTIIKFYIVAGTLTWILARYHSEVVPWDTQYRVSWFQGRPPIEVTRISLTPKIHEWRGERIRPL